MGGPAASAIWAACLVYSVTSAVGVAVEDRSSRTGNRETIVMNYDEFNDGSKAARGQAERPSCSIVQHQTRGCNPCAPAPPVESYRRTPSTVGETSDNCQRPISEPPRPVPRWLDSGKNRGRQREERLDRESRN